MYDILFHFAQIVFAFECNISFYYSDISANSSSIDKGILNLPSLVVISIAVKPMSYALFLISFSVTSKVNRAKSITSLYDRNSLNTFEN